MSSLFAFCPQCKNEVVFEKEGNVNRCPTCGFRYEISSPSTYQAPPVVMGIAKVLMIVFLLMAGVVVVGAAILFAACANAFR